jgi:hypothetical protein
VRGVIASSNSKFAFTLVLSNVQSTLRPYPQIEKPNKWLDVPTVCTFYFTGHPIRRKAEPI